MHVMGRDIHTCSDCVHTRDDTDRLTYASRFVRVIYRSHIVSIKLGTVTLLRRLWTGSTRTTGRSSFSGATRTRPGGATHTPPGGAARVSPGNASSLPSSLRQCCPHPRGSRSGGATRTRLGGATRTRHPFHAALAVPSARVPAVPRTRLNVASPASVALHSIAWIARPALEPTLVIVGQTSARFTSRTCTTCASCGGSKFGVLRRFPISVIAASFIAGRRSHDGILPRTCCRSATGQHL